MRFIFTKKYLVFPSFQTKKAMHCPKKLTRFTASIQSSSQRKTELLLLMTLSSWLILWKMSYLSCRNKLMDNLLNDFLRTPLKKKPCYHKWSPTQMLLALKFTLVQQQPKLLSVARRFYWNFYHNFSSQQSEKCNVHTRHKAPRKVP